MRVLFFICRIKITFYKQNVETGKENKYLINLKLYEKVRLNIVMIVLNNLT